MLLTWLKQLFDNLFVRPQATPEALPEKEPTDREQAMRLNLELKNYVQQPLDPGVAGLIRVQSICPNIIQFTELLKELNATLRKEGALSAQRCNYTEATVNMSSFFQKDGYYIAHAKILDYQKEAEVFCALTEVCQEATFGVHEHNYRMLTKVFASLKNVNIGLIETLIQSAQD